MTSSAYDIVALQAAPRLVAGVRARVARGRVAQEFGRYLDQVYAAAQGGFVRLDGQNVFIYREADDQVLTVDFCVGAIELFPAVGNVEPLYTPSGVAATTTHRGAYAGISDANAAILAWCDARQRRRAGQSWEVYGHWHADPARLSTDVYHLLYP